MIQILLYANVLAFKRRVRAGGGGRGVSGTKTPEFQVQPYPIVDYLFPI